MSKTIRRGRDDYDEEEYAREQELLRRQKSRQHKTAEHDAVFSTDKDADE
jgi:hypothetical protein